MDISIECNCTMGIKKSKVTIGQSIEYQAKVKNRAI